MFRDELKPRDELGPRDELEQHGELGLRDELMFRDELEPRDELKPRDELEPRDGRERPCGAQVLHGEEPRDAQLAVRGVPGERSRDELARNGGLQLHGERLQCGARFRDETLLHGERRGQSRGGAHQRGERLLASASTPRGGGP